MSSASNNDKENFVAVKKSGLPTKNIHNVIDPIIVQEPIETNLDYKSMTGITMKPASLEGLEHWYDQGIKKNATHMIIMCDTFDYEDYPVYVLENEDVIEKYKEFSNKAMQKVMEVYDLRKKGFEVLEKKRVFDIELPNHPL
jgi:hypothetical protein